jgi:hypothetical protein
MILSQTNFTKHEFTTFTTIHERRHYVPYNVSLVSSLKWHPHGICTKFQIIKIPKYLSLDLQNIGSS